MAARPHRFRALPRKLQRPKHLDHVSSRSSSGETRSLRRHAADPLFLQNLSLRGRLQQQPTHHAQLANSILERTTMNKKLITLIIALRLTKIVSADTIHTTVNGMV